MPQRHHAFWPSFLGHQLPAPETNLYFNLEVSAARYPTKPFLVFYDTAVTFSEFKRDAERLAGYLEQRCGVRKGDRVALCMQNSPQFALAYYAILRANAVVVPINPMNLTAELRHHLEDSGATVALFSQELYPSFEPLVGRELQHAVVAAYSDYLREPTDLPMPEFVKAPRAAARADPASCSGTSRSGSGLAPGPLTVGPDDLCVLPYTSGTTGRPKGCMHTHRTVMHTALTRHRVVRDQPHHRLARRAAVLPRHRDAGVHERADVPGEHGRAHAALGPAGGGGADPAATGSPSGRASRRW